MIGAHKSQLETPCLLIDNEKLQHNLKTMQLHVNQHQKNYRPHCKTHKSSQIAKLQIAHGAIGLSVALISEAEGLFKAGLNNILITSPLSTPNKLNRFEHLISQQAKVLPVIDSLDLALQFNEMGKRLNQVLDVLIDVDGGIGRTGIQCHKIHNFALRLKSLSYLNISGIQCYAGHLQHIQDYSKRHLASTSVMQKAGLGLKALKDLGFAADILSGGGTGTYDIDVELEEVTEIQPGSYVMMDVEYHDIASKHDNSFEIFKPALTLLTSVVSANQKTHVTVDAGTKAIYFDSINYPTIISHAGLQYEWGGFGDEHGKIRSSSGVQLPLAGEYLEMIVPHCDPTINLHNQYYLMDNDIVIDIIRIDLRGY